MSTLIHVLDGLTEPHAADDVGAVAEAVRTFNERAKSASSSSSSVGDFVWEAFNAVFDVAGRTPPERQGGVVDLLGRLRHTTATDADGQPLTYEGGVVWKDMPSFAWVARDLWNFDVFDPSTTPRDRSKWDNWAALLAQLTTLASADDPRHPFDFSLFALWDMRTAFEETPPERAAVRHAGERLRRLCREGRTFEGNSGAARGKYADRGWRGFNEERWAAWRDELRAARDRHGVDDAAIQEASDRMERL
ncbi:hypothetical protein C8A03DRAFT_47882 [Achaetomium macrosporum]|uniref:Uncharacterized protein n=1 Tax=Achaetomium macrosporum TaxID=79813 RepID=A0AAN7C2K5_9PEZI|nr:hypothetical protein C8A03DRAFT_47882 [Achaetomium macrosporum]